MCVPSGSANLMPNYRKNLPPRYGRVPTSTSYSKDENGKVITNWPGYATDYVWRTWAVRRRDFEFAAET
jgi:hypothetical protein